MEGSGGGAAAPLVWLSLLFALLRASVTPLFSPILCCIVGIQPLTPLPVSVSQRPVRLVPPPVARVSLPMRLVAR